MLSELDDTLWHQIPSTFDHVGTSDPRFFDRYWFAIYEPQGRTALQFTLGVYNNMNVVDGGFVVVHGERQYNLRVSRSLRPRFETSVGPMCVEVVRPLEEFLLVVEPAEGSDLAHDHHVHGELRWRGVLPPEEEKPHFERIRGRVAQEYQRFDQVGVCTGWLDIAGERVELNDWWACRDHSWGVRPSMGIPEPVTGASVSISKVGSLFSFLFFSTDTLAGHLQIAERGAERTYLTGLVRDRRNLAAPDVHVVDATLRLEFHEGTRRFRDAVADVVFDDGRRASIRSSGIGSAIAMPGLGYSGGFDDTLGLGAWRGDNHREIDVWDVSDPARVVDERGTTSVPVHRIQPVHVTVTGDGVDGEGTGSHTLIANGNLPQYGLS
jgi:hypothetical protein